MRSMAFVAFALLFLNGCTFYCLDGNGPRSKKEFQNVLRNISPAVIEKLKYDAQNGGTFGNLTFTGRGEVKGYTVHGPWNLWWPALIGPYDTAMYYEPLSEWRDDKRELVADSETFGMLLGQITLGGETHYDVETGQALAVEKFFFFTPLIIYHSSTTPRDGVVLPLHPKEAIPEDLKYNQQSALCIGSGVLAAGVKNGRAYMQIAWIPIPLWRTSYGAS